MNLIHKNCPVNPSIHLVLFGLLLLFPQISMADSRIGLVKTYDPVAKVVRQGAEVDLQVGAEIFEGDTSLAMVRY
jgi:hypothetical protein